MIYLILFDKEYETGETGETKDGETKNGETARPANGNCSAYNVIYCFVCTKCYKGYVGRTVQRFSERAGKQRRDYCTMSKDFRDVLKNDIY